MRALHSRARRRISPEGARLPPERHEAVQPARDAFHRALKAAAFVERPCIVAVQEIAARRRCYTCDVAENCLGRSTVFAPRRHRQTAHGSMIDLHELDAAQRCAPQIQSRGVGRRSTGGSSAGKPTRADQARLSAVSMKPDPVRPRVSAVRRRPSGADMSDPHLIVDLACVGFDHVLLQHVAMQLVRTQAASVEHVGDMTFLP